jgi:hypothetical protein
MAGESGLQIWRLLTASRSLEDHEHTKDTEQETEGEENEK